MTTSIKVKLNDTDKQILTYLKLDVHNSEFYGTTDRPTDKINYILNAL